MFQATFGRSLMRIRKSKNFTQNDVAHYLNISRQAYSNYEQGRCSPSISTLLSLSDLFETDLITIACKSNFLLEKSNLNELIMPDFLCSDINHCSALFSSLSQNDKIETVKFMNKLLRRNLIEQEKF